jgi:hypothetical protein
MKVSVDGDGVRKHTATGLGAIARLLVPAALAVSVAVVVSVVAIRLSRARPSPEAPPAPAAAVPRTAAAGSQAAPASAPAPSVPAPAKVRPVRRSALPAEAATAPPAGAPAAPPELNAKDVIPMLRAAGETGGIAAFPPPGTKPLRRGIVVPEGFELPEGYVRHFQTTDDGKQLEPILMFHPDYVLVDERGEAVPLPESRIVPPELAPPGLTVRMLDVPESDRTP